MGDIAHLRDITMPNMTLQISGLLLQPPFKDDILISDNIDLLKPSNIVSLMSSEKKKVVVSNGFYGTKNPDYGHTPFPVVKFTKDLWDNGIDVEMSDCENGVHDNPLGYLIHQNLEQRIANGLMPIRHLSLKIPLDFKKDELTQLLHFTSTFCGSLN